MPQGAGPHDQYPGPDDSPASTTSLTIIEPATRLPVPAMIAGAGERASLRYIAFFTANIRNPNTRATYGVAVRSFFARLERPKIGVHELGAIRSHQGKRWSVRLHEKGGKQHEMPAHHLLEQYLDAYVTAPPALPPTRTHRCSARSAAAAASSSPAIA